MGTFFYVAITIEVLAIVMVALGARILYLRRRQKVAFGILAGVSIVLLTGQGWQNVKRQRLVEQEAKKANEESMQALKRMREATAETEKQGQEYRRELSKLVGQQAVGAASGSNLGNVVNKSPAGPRALASDQRGELVKLLKKMGPHEIVVRYAQDSEESQRYANALAGALRDAGWKFRSPKFLLWNQDPQGVVILVQDLQAVPRDADEFALALNKVGIEVKWQEESSLDPGTFDLMVGLQ